MRRLEITPRVQTIFCIRNEKSGDILVKVMHNENEVHIPVETDMFTLCHELGLTFEDVAIAIGWLARENKILLRKKEGMLYASIENVEFTFG